MQFAYKPRSGAIWSSKSSLGSTFKQGTFLSGKTAAHARKLAQKRKLQAFRGSTQTEVEAGTRTVKGLDLSKGPKTAAAYHQLLALGRFHEEEF